MIALIDYGAGNLTSVKKALAALGADVVVPSRPEQLASAHGVIVPGVGHFGATRALEGAWKDAIVQRIGEGRPVLGICLGMQWLFEGSDEASDVAGLGVLAGRCYRLGAIRQKPDTTYNADGTDPDERRVRRQPDHDVRGVRLQPDHDVRGVRLQPDHDVRGVRLQPDHDVRGVRLQPDHDVRGVRLQPDQRVKVPHVGWNGLAIDREASIVHGVADGAQVYFTHSYVAPLTSDTVAITEHGETFASIVQHGQIAGVQFHPEKSGDVGLRVLRNFLQLAE